MQPAVDKGVCEAAAVPAGIPGVRGREQGEDTDGRISEIHERGMTMGVPSILNCDAEERRRRYKKALRRERMELVIEPIKRAMPVIAGDLMALIMCAALFTVSAMLLISVM